MYSCIEGIAFIFNFMGVFVKRKKSIIFLSYYKCPKCVSLLHCWGLYPTQIVIEPFLWLIFSTLNNILLKLKLFFFGICPEMLGMNIWWWKIVLSINLISFHVSRYTILNFLNLTIFFIIFFFQILRLNSIQTLALWWETFEKITDSAE